MVHLFIQEEEKSFDSENTTTDIMEGEPVVREVGGGMHRLDPANDTRWDGVLVHRRNHERIAEHDEDWIGYEDFYLLKAGAENASLQPAACSSVLLFWTPWDESLTEPTYEKNEVVGFADLGNGPRVVPDGYSDGNGTTYGTSAAGDFVVAGRVDHELSDFTGDAYKRRLEVRLDKDLI